MEHREHQTLAELHSPRFNVEKPPCSQSGAVPPDPQGPMNSLLRFDNKNIIVTNARIQVNPTLPAAAGVQKPVASAYVTDVIGCVYLHLESIRIKKFERFLGLGAEEFQTAFLKFGANLVGVEMGNSEVVMVDRSCLVFSLLNPKEGITDPEDVHRR
jgi:hypothetical protein